METKKPSRTFKYRGTTFETPYMSFFDQSLPWCPWFRVDTYDFDQPRGRHVWNRKLFFVNDAHEGYEPGDIRGVLAAVVKYVEECRIGRRFMSVANAFMRGKLFPGMSFGVEIENGEKVLYLIAMHRNAKGHGKEAQLWARLGTVENAQQHRFRDAWLAAYEWLEDHDEDVLSQLKIRQDVEAAGLVAPGKKHPKPHLSGTLRDQLKHAMQAGLVLTVH